MKDMVNANGNGSTEKRSSLPFYIFIALAIIIIVGLSAFLFSSLGRIKSNNTKSQNTSEQQAADQNSTSTTTPTPTLAPDQKGTIDSYIGHRVIGLKIAGRTDIVTVYLNADSKLIAKDGSSLTPSDIHVGDSVVVNVVSSKNSAFITSLKLQ